MMLKCEQCDFLASNYVDLTTYCSSLLFSFFYRASAEDELHQRKIPNCMHLLPQSCQKQNQPTSLLNKDLFPSLIRNSSL